MQRAASLLGFAKLLSTTQLPDNLRFLPVDPTVFTHAHLLLGEHPQRFDDVAYYLATVQTFFQKQGQVIAARVSSGEKLALPSVMPEGYDPVHAAALVDFCQMLLNSNEFVYRN